MNKIPKIMLSHAAKAEVKELEKERDMLKRIVDENDFDLIPKLEARIKSLENEVKTFRQGENYIKQFEDAKHRCAVMYNPDEVFNRERLESWADENGFAPPEQVKKLEAQARRLTKPVTDEEANAIRGSIKNQALKEWFHNLIASRS